MTLDPPRARTHTLQSTEHSHPAWSVDEIMELELLVHVQIDMLDSRVINRIHIFYS